MEFKSITVTNLDNTSQDLVKGQNETFIQEDTARQFWFNDLGVRNYSKDNWSDQRTISTSTTLLQATGTSPLKCCNSLRTVLLRLPSLLHSLFLRYSQGEPSQACQIKCHYSAQNLAPSHLGRAKSARTYMAHLSSRLLPPLLQLPSLLAPPWPQRPPDSSSSLLWLVQAPLLWPSAPAHIMGRPPPTCKSLFTSDTLSEDGLTTPSTAVNFTSTHLLPQPPSHVHFLLTYL